MFTLNISCFLSMCSSVVLTKLKYSIYTTHSACSWQCWGVPSRAFCSKALNKKKLHFLCSKYFCRKAMNSSIKAWIMIAKLYGKFLNSQYIRTSAWQFSIIFDIIFWQQWLMLRNIWMHSSAVLNIWSHEWHYTIV